MSSLKVQVREKSTGQTFTVWPVDARALISSGEYEPLDEIGQAIGEGRTPFPLRKPHPTDAVSVKAAHEAEMAAITARTAPKKSEPEAKPPAVDPALASIAPPPAPDAASARPSKSRTSRTKSG